MDKLMWPIRMYACHDDAGNISPLRFRVENEAWQRFTISIEKVIQRDEEKVDGRRMLNFRCRGSIGRRVGLFDLSYELSSCRWYLARW